MKEENLKNENTLINEENLWNENNIINEDSLENVKCRSYFFFWHFLWGIFVEMHINSFPKDEQVSKIFLEKCNRNAGILI